MTHWIGAIILLVAFVFVIFAFRQGEKIKSDKDKKSWWDDGGLYR
jgi:steroid 5-alpha reductase family enzyme